MTESSLNKVPLESPSNQPRSLMQRVIKGSIWTLGGHVTSQGIRLVSNLIVSRLLFPEAFGLMALVFTFISGLEMLSDLGIGPNIIQSKRGDDPKFLNTAWMLAIARGCFLWLCSCVIAWPISQFYKEPSLAFLLPAAAICTLMSGFVSTKWSTASRHLNLGRLTTIDLMSQILGIVVMIFGAWVAHITKAPKDIAVWALVIGSLASSALRLFLSHFYLPGERNRFEWDPASFKELQSFGKWVFISTLLTFFALQSNNLVIPRLLGVGFLGIFSFASNLSRMATDILSTVGSRVLFPSYSELARERPERLYPVLKRSRMVLNVLNAAASMFFIFFGKTLIGIMYDARYADAGWMLQILSIGSMVNVLGSTYTNVLLAQGKTFIMSVLMGIQVVIQFACMFLGYYFGGEFGVIVGISAMNWFLYPFQAICYSRLHIWQPEVDLPVIALASGLAALAFFHYI